MSDLASEVAAVIEAGLAEHRAAALAQIRMGRISLTRNLGRGTQIGFEANVDSAASAEEIYGLFERADAAIDRHKAKIDLFTSYDEIAHKLAEIETAMRNYAEKQVEFDAENAAENLDRHGTKVALGRTEQQNRHLAQMRQGIRGLREGLDALWKNIEEQKRMLSGEEPFAVLEAQLALHEERIIGTRSAA